MTKKQKGKPKNGKQGKETTTSNKKLEIRNEAINKMHVKSLLLRFRFKSTLINQMI